MAGGAEERGELRLLKAEINFQTKFKQAPEQFCFCCAFSMSGGRSFPHASTRFFLLFFSLLYPQGHIGWNRPSCTQNCSAIEMRFGESSQAAQTFSLGFTCNYGLSYLELTNAPAQPLKSWPRRALRALCAEAPELQHHPSCAAGSSRAQMSLIKKCLDGHLENELFLP